MEKMHNQIIGMPVMMEDVARPLTTVKELVINPDHGKVEAFVTDLVNHLVVTPADVLKMDKVLLVHGPEDIIEGADVLRVKRIWEEGLRFHKAKVVTESGKSLGRVVDYAINMELLELTKLHTAKSILGLARYDQRLIARDDIVEVLPGKIVVKDDLGVVEEMVQATG